MKLPTLTQIGKGEAYFHRYEDGNIWYDLFWREDGGPISQTCDNKVQWCFEFPIPVSDAGAGAFKFLMSGLSILRWARKHVEFLQQARAAEGQL